MTLHATFWEHIGDLRKALVRALSIILLGTLCAFFFCQDLISFITLPLNPSSSLVQHEIKHVRVTNTSPINKPYVLKTEPLIPASVSPGTKKTNENSYLIPPNGFIEYQYAINPNSLVMLSPTEGIVTSFKVSFWVGLVSTSPIWMYFLLQFVIPALKTEEKRALWPFMCFSVMFLFIGLSFAFYITIPLANQYLQIFNEGLGTNLWTLSNYLDYTILLLLSNALAFEFSLLLFFLVHFNIISAETLAGKRRYMIVAAFIIGAILTPPDVLTQLLLAIPLIVLYELTIIYAKMVKTESNFTNQSKF